MSRRAVSWEHSASDGRARLAGDVDPRQRLTQVDDLIDERIYLPVSYTHLRVRACAGDRS